MPQENLKGIYISILNQGEIRVELAHLIAHLVAHTPYNIFYSYPADKPIESNRNKIVQSFLEKKEYEYLLMIDGDIVPPLNILDLAVYQKDIIGATCFAYRQQALVPLVLEKQKGNPNLYTVMKVEGTEGLIEADAVGTGCIMIHRRVLENKKLKHPFKNYYDKDGIRNFGLDLSFCKRAKDLGYKVYCHLDFTCSHWTPMDLKMIYKTMVQYSEKAGKKRGEVKMAKQTPKHNE